MIDLINKQQSSDIDLFKNAELKIIVFLKNTIENYPLSIQSKSLSNETFQSDKIITKSSSSTKISIENDREHQLLTLSRFLTQQLCKNQQEEVKSLQDAMQIIKKELTVDASKRSLKLKNLFEKILYQYLYLYILKRVPLTITLEQIKNIKGLDKAINVIAHFLHFDIQLKHSTTKEEVIKFNRDNWIFLKSQLEEDSPSSKPLPFINQFFRISFFSLALLNNYDIGIYQIPHKSKILQTEALHNFEITEIIKFTLAYYKTNPYIFKEYLEIVKEYITYNFISQSYYRNLMIFPLKIWEIGKEKETLGHFLGTLFTAEFKNRIQQLKYVLLSLLNSKLKNFYQDNIDILPYFEFLGQEVQCQLFLNYLPICIRIVQKKEDINIQLVNHLIEWRIRNHTRKEIKNPELELSFNKMFKDIIKYINSSNIIKMYMIGDECCFSLLSAIIKTLKAQKNPKLEEFQQILFPPALFSPETLTQSIFQTCLKIIIIFYFKFEKLDEILNIFQRYEKSPNFAYPLQSTQDILKKIYEESLIPFYYNQREKLTQKSFIYRIEVQSLLDLDRPNRTQELQQDIYSIVMQSDKIIRVFYEIFQKFSSSTSALTFLTAVFYISTSHDKFEKYKESCLKKLTKFLKKLNQSDFTLINAYSHAAFMELIYIYYLKEINSCPEIVNILIKIILQWVHYIGLKEIYQVFQSCKFDYLSQCLTKRKKLLMKLTRAQSIASIKIFLFVNQRYQRFMVLYQMIINKYHMHTVTNPRHLLKSGNNSQKPLRLSLTYDIIEGQNPDFKIYIKIVVDKRTLGNYPHNVKVVSGSEKKHFRIQIAQEIKIYERNMNEKILNQESSLTDIINLEFDFQISNKQINIRINQMKNAIHLNNLDIPECAIQLETSYSFIELIQVCKGTMNQRFNFTEPIEHKGNVHLRIQQLNQIRADTVKEYLELKYLFTSFYQMVRNHSIENLNNLPELYQNLLKIIFLTIETTKPKKSSDEILYFLEKVTKILSEHENKFPFRIIEEKLRILSSNYSEFGEIVFGFAINILLNFDIWINCPYQAQYDSILLFQQLLKIKQFKQHCLRQKISYQKLVAIKQNHYNIRKSDSYKGISILQRQEIRQLIQNISLDLIDYENIKNFKERISINLETLIKLEDSRLSNNSEKDSQTHQEFEVMIIEFFAHNDHKKKITNPNHLKEHEKLKVERLVEFFQWKLIRIITRFVNNVEHQIRMIEMLFKLIQFIPDHNYAVILKSILPCVGLTFFVEIYEQVQALLYEYKHKENNFSESIIELLNLLALHFKDCPEHLQQNIIMLISIYIQEDESNHNIEDNRFRTKLIEFLLKHESIKLLIIFEMNVDMSQLAKKLIQNYFKFVLQLKKKDFFIFTQYYRQITLDPQHNQSIRPFQIYLTQIRNDWNQHHNIYILSIALQYCFEILCSLKNSCTQQQEELPNLKNQKVFSNEICQIVYKFLYSIITNKNQTGRLNFYYTYPGIGYPDFKKSFERPEIHSLPQLNFSNNNIASSRVIKDLLDNRRNKHFEIKGGILFKLLLVIFKLWELKPLSTLIDLLQIIFLKNLDESGNFKKLHKSRMNAEKATKDFSIFSTEIKNSHIIMDAIQKAKKEFQEYSTKQDPDIGESVYDRLPQEKSLELFCFEYSIMKLQGIMQSFSITELENEENSNYIEEYNHNKQIPQKLEKFLLEIKDRFPIFKTSSELKSDFHLLKPMSYPIFKQKNFGGNLIFSQRNLESPVYPGERMGELSPVKFLTPKEQPESQLFSSARKLMFEKKTSLVDIKNQNWRVYGMQLVKLEFFYTFLLQDSDSYDTRLLSSQIGQNEYEAKLRQDFLKQMQKQHNRQSLELGQKIFKLQRVWQNLKKFQKQDGILHQKPDQKKPPIRKLKNVQLPSLSRPITKLTTKYNYKVERQLIMDKNLRLSLLQKYSNIKKQSFLTHGQNQYLALKEIIETDINDRKILKFDCEIVTRLGVYFGSFQVDINHQMLHIEASKDGRPDRKELRFGSSKQYIIKNKSKRKRIYFTDISQIQTRKFCQIYRNSIQIFTKKSKSYFIMLYEPKNVEKVFQCLKKFLTQNQLIYNCEETFRKRRYTEKWQNGEISNFQYLMLVNKFAGRSYNDTNQAYVFPWVLNDYSSKEIDLRKESNYRDLKYPMGALNQKKFAAFEGVYDQDTRYYYGRLFSTPMYLYYFLIRIQPYSSLAQQLQGETFDAPDRLFFSINNVWQSLQSEVNQDVKQLIPQFYYYPTFLENTNDIKFGNTQQGIPVNHVILPPWAHNNANEFVTIMRAALESDYVSRNLNLWIDLIFGVHQNSEKRKNIFEYMYYHENINYKNFEEFELDALIDRICGWGQFPIKLFRTDEHPEKKKKLKFFESTRTTLAKYQKKIEVMPKKIFVQEIKIAQKKLILKVLDNKIEKYFAVDSPIFDNIGKQKPIQKNTIHFQPYLTILEKKEYYLYLINKDNEIYLKQLNNVSRSAKKIVVGERFIAECGTILRLVDFEQNQYFRWEQEEVLNALFVNRSIIFITKSGDINKYDLQKKLMILLHRQPDPIKYQVKLVGYQDKNEEFYVICIDKKKIIYINRNI